MPTTLGDLARLVGGALWGDAALELSGAATLGLARPGEITLADHPDRDRELAASPAAAVIATPDVECSGKPAIIVKDVHAAFAAAVSHFRPPRLRQRIGVSPAATVSLSAKLGPDVDVCPGATIGDNCEIGAGTIIHPGVHIMADCVIGAGATIFPNAVLYENTRVGDRTIIHAGAVIGAYGFGYRNVQGRHQLSAQLGHVEIGKDVEIGAGTTIDRGTYGPTVIGEGTKIDNLVMIAHNCRLGRHNLICSQVGIAGSTTTGDYVVMAGQVGIRDHVHIGDRAVICSKAGVSNDVEPGAEMLGAPAAPLRQAKLQMAAVAKLPEMRRQFRILQRQIEELRGETPAAENDQTHPHDKAA
ncbi:MAG TPA: UDP-3-O-(3-hydroxymyristoyl)glucosamine N-acyltransferase [Lacipirellulaceae bacterium]|nr:UDP-3-O-(3-hydroxymyristoyl)glucosamine N-acyltransferase [Lacipirellulaceae bacterium]